MPQPPPPTMPPGGDGNDAPGLGPRPPPPPPPSSSSSDYGRNCSSALITNQILTNLPRHQPRATTTTATADPPLPPHGAATAEVDDSIARRRAELRRLQQRGVGGGGGGGRVASSLAVGVGGGVGVGSALASARSRLGGVGGGAGAGAGAGMRGGSVRRHVEEIVREASSVAAPSYGRSKLRPPAATTTAAIVPPAAPPVAPAPAPARSAESTPIVTAAPHPPTPTTATITRRLDYDSCGGGKTAGGGGGGVPGGGPRPPADPPAVVIPRRPPPPSRHQDGRLRAQDVLASSGDDDGGGDAHHDRRTSEIFPVGKRSTRENNVGRVDVPAAGAPFNPFSPSGPVRATARTSSSSSLSSAAAATMLPVVRTSGVVRVPLMAPAPRPAMTKDTSTRRAAVGGEGKGKDIPPAVRSVDDEPPRPPTLVEEEEEEEVVGEDGGGATTATTTSPSSDDDDGDENNDEATSGRATPVTSNVHEDVQRLMTVLERTEREKREALEQVEMLRTLLDSSVGAAAIDRQHHRDGERREIISHRPHRRADVGPPGDDGARGGGGRSSRRPSAAGDDDENLLISSVVPPLTPRARPGSRAASPERGGGGDAHHRHLDGGGGGAALPGGGGGGGGASGGGGRPGGKRTTTPLPRQSSSVEEVVVEDEYLLRAARCIPNAYGTRLASYIVRRPYIVDDDDDGDGGDGGTWSRHAHLTDRGEYPCVATASDPNTLELLAHVEADGSVFTLTGRSDARHSRFSAAVAAAPSGGGGGGGGSFDDDSSLEWVVFDDVESMDRALGKVTYIDVEGNERDYWLDSIYEEALTTRESYCMSLISAAYALKEVMGDRSFAMPTAQNVPVQQQQPPTVSAGGFERSPNASSNDIPQSAEPAYQAMRASDVPLVAVAIPSDQETTQKSSEWREPISFPDESPPHPMPSAATPNDQRRSSESKPIVPTTEDAPKKTRPDEKQSSTKTQPEEEYEPADSALTFMLIYLFSLFFSIPWFFVKILLRIGSLLFKSVAMIVALRVLWLLLADDNGACEIGACVDHRYNMPGIY